MLDDATELLGSMRFAVSLLMFICVASVIGTVLPQGRAASTYIDQFGPFWFELFDKFSIWHVYNSWWFLLIMAFLVVSTSLCVVRNAPKMLQDARSFREYVRASSLRAFPHRAEADSSQDVAATAARLLQMLQRQGYAVRERRDGDSVMLAAKRGSGNRLGYIFAHASIVIICVGGLFDSELPVRMQVLLGGKQPLTENMLISEVPEYGRLAAGNPSFRANVLVPEGSRISNAVVLVGEGALVQPLPFTLQLDKFIIDYYSTGMPSRFASEVTVTDPDDGSSFQSTIEVNEPLRFKGVTVYQSSFDDGGSRVVLTGRPLAGPQDYSIEVDGKVGESSQVMLRNGEQALQLDVTGLRPINVEDLRSGEPPQPKAWGEHVAAVTGSAAGVTNEHLRNVGPSIEYRLLDASGQAHEFHNYMLPVQLDEIPVFLAGVRTSQAENYRYLRIPMDERGTADEFLALRAALADPALRREAARRFAQTNAGNTDSGALQNSAERALETFSVSGLQGVARFLESNVAAAELPRAADIVIRLLGAAMGELRVMVRERQGWPVLPADGDAAQQADTWSRMAVAALSDLALYPVPVLFTLSDFEHVQASVFQVSRAPGKNAVYLGCLLLVLGIFTMFYVRDRRIWLWVAPRGEGSHVMAAMTSQKRTLDFNREFERLKQALGRLA